MTRRSCGPRHTQRLNNGTRLQRVCAYCSREPGERKGPGRPTRAEIGLTASFCHFNSTRNWLCQDRPQTAHRRTSSQYIRSIRKTLRSPLPCAPWPAPARARRAESARRAQYDALIGSVAPSPRRRDFAKQTHSAAYKGEFGFIPEELAAGRGDRPSARRLVQLWHGGSLPQSCRADSRQGRSEGFHTELSARTRNIPSRPPRTMRWHVIGGSPGAEFAGLPLREIPPEVISRWHSRRASPAKPSPPTRLLSELPCCRRLPT